jgi:hypothetical protein
MPKTLKEGAHQLHLLPPFRAAFGIKHESRSSQHQCGNDENGAGDTLEHAVSPVEFLTLHGGFGSSVIEIKSARHLS